ncbi:DUF4358 domain-containing protein [Vermiculatibacterium agrestimuris]|uniref:DUF4358 domain-containing protein n=1 Tax=Vermiculatibacterium agrestimuris TaxID=2941519 RepID=UPI00204056B6|nr:DUF4358 domain-containing protein [Vermiculatibacterium agrestimuris]
MKKILSGIVFAVLCLSLTACGGKTAEFSPAQDAAELREAEGAFTTALTQIDQATACALYGIDEATVTASAVYASPSSAEELAIFTLDSDEAAQAAQTALGYRVEDRLEELEDYMPEEMDKLKDAVIEKRGSSVLLVIASDYGPVSEFLEG